jgi:plasmid stability protein
MPRTTKLTQKAVYLPQELIELWKASAFKHRRSMNQELRVALEFYLASDNQARKTEHLP